MKGAFSKPRHYIVLGLLLATGAGLMVQAAYLHTLRTQQARNAETGRTQPDLPDHRSRELAADALGGIDQRGQRHLAAHRGGDPGDHRF